MLGDDVINAVELKVALKKLLQYTTEDEAKNMMNRLDSDGDGVVTFEEFCDHFYDFWSNDMLDDTEETKTPNKNDESRVEDKINMETFSVFDKDGNGYIEIEELRQVVQRYLRLQDETEDFTEERIVDLLHLVSKFKHS
jgi:Ca2+-binding EF-hand superfamily protein